MEGLTVIEGCPDVKTIKTVCNVLLKDLYKRFCNWQLVECVILLWDPSVDSAIIQFL